MPWQKQPPWSDAQLREAVEQRHTHEPLCDLTPERACHHPFSQALDAQAKLNRRITEYRLATAFATGQCVPLHVLVQPDQQRAALL